MVVTRFCPTPDGQLHHGNLYVAILNQEFARRCGGRFEVQIDDLVSPFAHPEITEGILEDLEWLGVCDRARVLAHSRNKAAYVQMLDRLEAAGRVRIRRAVRGCCVARVEIAAGGRPLRVAGARSSRPAEGVAGWLPFAAEARHVLAGGGVAVVPGALGWRHDTYWCSHPEEAEAFLEFELAAPARPESLEVTWWDPVPLEVEVLVSGQGARAQWRRVARVKHAPTRTPGYHLGWFIPRPDEPPEKIPLQFAGTEKAARLRLVMRGMQPIENYEMCAPAGEECLEYEDLCGGRRTAKRTVAQELRLYQFGRAASDVILKTTHVIRGDDLIEELDLYVQCLAGLDCERPVLCHVPRLVDDRGEKLSKSENNAPRIADKLRAMNLNPPEARRWIVERAYENVARRGPLHSFKAQLARLAATVEEGRRARCAGEEARREEAAGLGGEMA